MRLNRLPLGGASPAFRGLLLAVALLAVAPTSPAWPACDLIPQSQQSFRSTLGTVNRPFASPGDVVEIDVRETLCDTASDDFGPTAEEHVVTVIFEPVLGKQRAVVLTTEDCGTPAMTSKLAACQATLGSGSSATCERVNEPLKPVGIALVNRINGQHLTFRFPNTDGLVTPDGDLRSLAGPASIAVTSTSDPLPCGVGPGSCSTEAGLIACVDRLFNADGSCDANVDPIFSSFTALPTPNDYSQTCFADDPPCSASAPAVRLTADGQGNILVPMNWRGVLANQPGQSIPRLLRGTFKPPIPLTIPSLVFLTSHTPEGASLPPIFEPQFDPATSDSDALTLFGSVDSPASVLRIARRGGVCDGGALDGELCASNRDCGGSPCLTACIGGPNEGLPCAKHGECEAGRCGELYDGKLLNAAAAKGPALNLARLEPAICEEDPQTACDSNAECGVGNLCVTYALQAKLAVALESLVESSADVLALTVRESVVADDLTGDGDELDTVALVHDRETGQVQPLGAPDGFDTDGSPLASCGIAGTPSGRAVLRVNDPPFELPAFDTHGEVAAFLESEIGANYCDLNGDGDHGDAILRVFDLAQGELTSGVMPARAVDGAPRIDGRAVVVSGGKVFFRTSESAMASQELIGVSVTPTGDAGNGLSELAVVSGGGGCVVFESLATNLTALPDTNGHFDIYLRELPAGPTELVSVDFGGGIANHESTYAFVSEDCRFVAFNSPASDLLAPGLDTNGLEDVFVRDRCISNGSPVPGCTPATERVNISTAGDEADGDTWPWPEISADGRFVAFSSDATNLLGPGVDTNGVIDIFVRDRCLSHGEAVPGCTPSTERVSVQSGGVQFGTESQFPSITADGRYVGFKKTSPGFDVYLHDRDTDTTTILNVTPEGAVSNGALCVSLSPDGRYAAFASSADDLTTEADVNGDVDVFVRDLSLGVTQRVSVSTGGEGLSGPTFPSCYRGFFTDTEARHVLFDASTFDPTMPGPAPANRDAFIHDRRTRTTDRLIIGSGGTSGSTRGGSISWDGKVIAFESSAPDLLTSGDDSNASFDIFARISSATEPLSVDDLLFDDDLLDDTVLEVLDTAGGPPVTLCPAEDVAVAGGMALFLRPESASGTASCPGGSLNGPGDMDTDDLVVQFWDGSGPVENAGLAGTAVAMSATRLAALVSEDGQGEALNGDGPDGDDVLHVRDVGGGAWTNVGQAADTVKVCGSVVVFITPEAAQSEVLNGDGLMDDRVLQIYDLATTTLVPVGQAAEDFVCNGQLVAFRTSEAAQGVNLNPDGGDVDMADDVVQVWDLAGAGCLTASPPASCLFNSETAVTPCDLEACDPRTPYRVLGRTAKFLTLECEQGGAVTAGTPPCAAPGGTDLNADGSADDLILQLLDRDQEIVLPIAAVEEEAEQNPFGGGGSNETTEEEETPEENTGTVLIASGRCIETSTRACGLDTDCEAGEFCQDGFCATDHRPCESTGECSGGAVCEEERTTPASPDSDGDGVPDHVDNCPFASNGNQVDDDGDGVGNECDLATCGDGELDYGEQCEVGNDSQCAGPCNLDSCTCSCGNTVADPKAKITVNTRKGAGKLAASMQIDLGSYTGTEPVRVHLRDTDSEVIAVQPVGTLAPIGKSVPPKTWGFKSREDGVQTVQLKSLAPKQPGAFKLKVKAKGWFSAAAANQPAANTTLTISIGTQCFSHAVTLKTD